MHHPATNAIESLGVSSPPLIVLAGSAGSLEALIAILAALPADFPAAIVVSQHRGTSAPSQLETILRARTALQVRAAEDRQSLAAGQVYVCPVGMHMMVDPRIRLLAGPYLHHVRPSADLLLGSVAAHFGPRALCVVLSGTGVDGSVGSLALRMAGGRVLAQRVSTSEFASMPRAAVDSGAAKEVLSPAEIPSVLRAWAARESRSGRDARDETTIVLVDDHQVLVEGIRVLLEREPGMRVVAIADSARLAVLSTLNLAPDVVIMDICMPGLDGIEATREIVTELPATRVIALSALDDPRTVDGIFRAGASGYLTKWHASRELVRAIRSVLRGQVYMSNDIAGLLARDGLVPPRTPRAKAG